MPLMRTHLVRSSTETRSQPSSQNNFYRLHYGQHMPFVEIVPFYSQPIPKQAF